MVKFANKESVQMREFPCQTLEMEKTKKKIASPSKQPQETTTTADKEPSPISWKTVSIGLILSLLAASIGTHFIVKSPIDAQSFTLPPVPPLKGPLRPNNFLSKVQRLLVDQVYGPESIAVHPNGTVYAGMRTGLICEIEIKGDKVSIVRALRLTSFTDCDGSYSSMAKCGRPLGLRFTSSGELLVADAYLGLFSIDLVAAKVYTLFSGGADVVNDPTRPVRYLNDLDILPDDRIVLSESSTRFDDRDYIYDLLEHKPNGRLLIFDPKKNEIRTAIASLYFPNGIQVVRGKVFIAEMGNARILRFSPSSLEIKVMTESLPGYPDSLRLSRDGSLLVAIPQLRNDTDNYLSERPGLRNFITKVLSRQALTALIEYFTTPYGLILKIDTESGWILESYHDSTGHTVSDISIAVEDNEGNLLLGSDINYFIGKLKK